MIHLDIFLRYFDGKTYFTVEQWKSSKDQKLAFIEREITSKDQIIREVREEMKNKDNSIACAMVEKELWVMDKFKKSPVYDAVMYIKHHNGMKAA
ncbi:hypothetical protein Ddye_005711 [Dipteronia dyeriana]|uniref:Uncharacterized protein n=1 Tax=Dipteronia dyeriana TaxID=168575 RepID=A0AAD9XH12_9ROSI|nr:hypothetical protein Ddye_005711 [Dipteronia dyeriana]